MASQGNGRVRITLEPGRPVTAETLEALREALGRSFALEHLRAGPEGLEVGVRDDVAAGVLEALVRRALRAGRGREPALLFRHDPARPAPLDPQPALEARGDVRPLGRGTFVLSGQFLRVRNAVRAGAAAIAAALGAEEIDNPPLLPLAVARAAGYLHDFPHLVLLAGGLREDFSTRDGFARRQRRDGPGVCEGAEVLAPPGHVLAPAVCLCCYWGLRGRRDVTDQVLTVSTPVFRNEASAERRLDRLTGFTVTDVVLVGSEGFVLDGRERLVGALRELAVGLDLACTLEAAEDPFFANEAMLKPVLQQAERLKQELRAELPWGRTLAIASVNLHRDHFSRAYDYRDAQGVPPWSACMGLGLERFAYALFCRHGVETQAWPEGVRAALRLT